MYRKLQQQHQQHESTAGSDIVDRLQRQLEFYFSDSNLLKDRFMMQKIEEDPEGYVPITMFFSFNKVKSLTQDSRILVQAIKRSTLLMLSGDNKRVKRVAPLPSAEAQKALDERTLYIEKITHHVTHEAVIEVFARYGKVSYVSIPRFDSPSTSSSSNSDSSVKEAKGFAFVEFAEESSAKQALERFFSDKEQYMQQQGDGSKQPAIEEDGEAATAWATLSPLAQQQLQHVTRILRKQEWSALTQEYRELHQKLTQQQEILERRMRAHDFAEQKRFNQRQQQQQQQQQQQPKQQPQRQQPQQQQKEGGDQQQPEQQNKKQAQTTITVTAAPVPTPTPTPTPMPTSAPELKPAPAPFADESNFVPGLILKLTRIPRISITGTTNPIRRKDIQMLMSSKPGVAFVEYRNERLPQQQQQQQQDGKNNKRKEEVVGELEDEDEEMEEKDTSSEDPNYSGVAYIRFSTPEYASLALSAIQEHGLKLRGEYDLGAQMLEGEAEKNYWKKIAKRKNRKQQLVSKKKEKKQQQQQAQQPPSKDDYNKKDKDDEGEKKKKKHLHFDDDTNSDDATNTEDTAASAAKEATTTTTTTTAQLTTKKPRVH